MTELSFLLDLLLNEKLSKSVKEKITARVKEIEVLVASSPTYIRNFQAQQMHSMPPGQIVNGAPQSPSTIAAMQRQAVLQPTSPDTSQIDQSVPPVIVASPAAAQAIANRNQAINEGINSVHGKGVPGRTSPRKF